MCCVSQLEYIVCHQQQPPNNNNNNTVSSFPKQTLSGTVGFVEDRIRAAQVDMVVSQQPSAAIQYRMVKCHILILYLLGNVNPKTTSCKYEATFGRQALSAAMTNYWEEPQHPSRNANSKNHDDDILCFMALQQLSQYYTGNNGSTESLSFILDYYRRNVQVHRQQLKDFPRFQWALQLVHLAIMDRPQSILRQLAELGDINISSSSDESTTGTAEHFACSTEFAVLCRCCFAPGVVDILRFKALEQYNKVYMKGEKVSTKELARLLHFREAEDAEDFAIQMAGLTKLETDSGGNDDSEIVFKLGPVVKSDQLGSSGRRRQDDEFVFGCLYNNSYWPCTQVNRKSQSTAWDDMPALSSETGGPTVNGAANNVPEYSGARIDMEGVPIPPPDLLYPILVSPSSSKGSRS